MPEMDGHTATRILRADARFETLPIVAMTAHAMVEERRRCLESGMNDHITKPIDPDTLFATIRRWVTPRQTPAAPARETSVREPPRDRGRPDRRWPPSPRRERRALPPPSAAIRRRAGGRRPPHRRRPRRRRPAPGPALGPHPQRRRRQSRHPGRPGDRRDRRTRDPRHRRGPLAPAPGINSRAAGKCPA